MTLYPCSACRKRADEKLSQVTWAWKEIGQPRHAYRQRLCVACFVDDVLSLDKPLDLSGDFACPGCGIETKDDFQALYVTSYLPGYGKKVLELPMCEPCFLAVRERVVSCADPLPDREGFVEGPAGPSTDPHNAAWVALGLNPHDG